LTDIGERDGLANGGCIQKSSIRGGRVRNYGKPAGRMGAELWKTREKKIGQSGVGKKKKEEL